MRTGEAAALLGVSISTTRNWLDRDDLALFFSTSGRGIDGSSQRVLSETDLLILNTVRHLRNVEKLTDWRDIVSRLDNDFRVQEFPQNAISADPRTIPLPQAEQSVRAAATLAERDSALARVEELQNELQRMKADYEVRLSDERTRNESQLAAERSRNDELHARLEILQREIGKLEMKIEMLQEHQSED